MGAWCGPARVGLVFSGLARERWEGRVCGGVGFCFSGRLQSF